jgi:peptidyl-dipeptidase Dcp
MDLCSDVTYPTLAGTSVARDDVSFPAQFNENYLSTPEVMAKFLRNAAGEPMSPDLIARIDRARAFNQGFDVVEFLASAIVDLRLHMQGDGAADPKALAAATLSKLGLPPEIAPRHPIGQFDHVFAGESDAAIYYNYLWAEVLAHDAFAAFVETSGPYDATTAKRLRDDILSVGATVDPNDAYRAFCGRDATVDAYLRAHGFSARTAA